VEKYIMAEKLAQIIGKENIKIDEPMKNHTSFKVGGPADVLVTPQNGIQIRDVLKLCKDNEYPVFVMGNGTNLLVKDKGIRGVVVKIYDNYNKIDVDGNMITAESGALLSVVSKIALKHSLKGFEFACGIPGTVGGAITMNAGAYTGEINDVVYSADVIDDKFNIITLKKDELELGYRKSIVTTKGYIILKVVLELENGDYDVIKDRIDLLTRKRTEKQPLSMPSAGSTFKRPEGSFAPKLIQEAGLKGRRVGDAMVSEMHSGFIVNAGEATAKDILSLIEIVREEVKLNSNILLEPEVVIIGEE
jgi:UDP-N-acetylmuramate dehydrogenase